MPSTAGARVAGNDAPYRVVFFERHVDDDPGGTVPGLEFLRAAPAKVRALMVAVIDDVAQSPPHRYSGGRYWQSMRAEMAGFYEVRCNGPGRVHYRLFCLIDHDAVDRHGSPYPAPPVVIVDGDSKANAALFDDKVYNRVRRHGTEYRARNKPRPIRDPSR